MEYGVVHLSKPGRLVSGDDFVFHQDRDTTLVAVIDGLGAGEAAHEAAIRAKECIHKHTTYPLPDLLALCHRALQGSRGAVMMFMRVHHFQKTVAFAGVGNIGVRVLGDTSIKPLSRNGIVGYRMNSVREFSYPYTEGDVFILHSDGISTRFTIDEEWARDVRTDVQEIARQIADNFGKDDDVTVIVTR
jgi:serine/threonine protein phosphatase PrpC